MVKVFKCVYLIIAIGICLLFSCVVVKFNPEIGNLAIVKDEYILNLIGSLMGLSIAVITILFTAIDKVKNNFLKNNSNNQAVDDIGSSIRNLYSSLAKDTMAIFVFFNILLISIFSRGIDIPFLKMPLGISKDELFLKVKLTLLFLSLSAMFDIIFSLYRIISKGMKITNAKE